MLERMSLSKTFHKTVGVGIAKARETVARRRLRDLEPGEYLVEPLPVYISQLADAERDLIEGFYGRIEDQKAAWRFGMEDLNQFSYWAWRSCGIAGVQAVVVTIRQANGLEFNKKTMDLVNEGLELKGYDTQTNKGWYHKSLVALAEKYGVSGSLHKYIPPSEIALILANSNYALASIKSDTGGHLLLLYGFRLNEKGQLEGFIHHDPNSFEKEGKGTFISRAAFDKLTTRRIISFSTVLAKKHKND
jgi:hypothetical protein